MMKKLIFLGSMIFNTQLFAQPTSEWFFIGSGGDVVQCRPSNSSNIAGLYSLDYLMARVYLGYEDHNFVSMTHWDESSVRIFKLLEKVDQAMAQDFKIFSEEVLASHENTRSYIWSNADFSLIDIPDERLEVKLPQNCQVFGENQIIQTIIRLNPQLLPENLRHINGAFNYDKKIIDVLSAKLPLQLSFLFVHEFLWAYAKDAPTIRQVNALLHSKEIETLSAAELKNVLLAAGVSLHRIN